MPIVSKRFPGQDSKPYFECLSSERPAAAPNEPILWHESDTGSWYIPNGVAWEGPFTAAEVGLGGGGGGSSDVTGLASPRFVNVANNAAPTKLGSGCMNWEAEAGTRGWMITAARLTANLASTTNIPNLSVYWGIAASDAEAATLLPDITTRTPSSTVNPGQVGAFQLSVESANSVTPGTFNLRLADGPVFIDISVEEKLLYFRQNTGGVLELWGHAVKEVA